jgi:hypothetical protein
MTKIRRALLLATLIGFITGVIWLVAVRFITYKSNNVHYHANFALYINGQRDEFKSFTFYEEVESCGSDQVNNPKTRVHLHDQKNHVVHVHDNGATWGHFFANLGYGLSDKAVTTDQGVYVGGQNSTEITYVLNGEKVDSVANRLIGNEDSLLIDVWVAKPGEPQPIRVMPEVPTDAKEYNQRNDPSSCAGSKPLTFGERLKKAIGLGE